MIRFQCHSSIKIVAKVQSCIYLGKFVSLHSTLHIKYFIRMMCFVDGFSWTMLKCGLYFFLHAYDLCSTFTIFIKLDTISRLCNDVR